MSKALDNYTLKNEAILAAAEELFLSLGYEKVTMDEVAKKAGVTKQTVYRYFSSKKLLLSALFKRDKEDEGSFEFSGGIVKSELRRYADAFVSAHMTCRRMQMYRLILCESGKHQELRDTFVSLAQSKWKRCLVSYFELRLQLSPEDSEMYASMLHALLMHMRSSIIMGIAGIPSESEIKTQVETCVDVFCSGFFSKLKADFD